MDLIDKLRMIRGRLSQAEFSSRINANQKTYSRYERGVSQPTYDILRNICDSFEISPEWLFFDAGCMHRAGKEYDLNESILSKAILLSEVSLPPSISPKEKATIIRKMYEYLLNTDQPGSPE